MAETTKKSLFSSKRQQSGLSWFKQHVYRHLSLKQAFFIIVLFNSFSILLCAISGYRIYTSAYNRLLFASVCFSGGQSVRNLGSDFTVHGKC